jgi:SAM-dependent methyltransferase
MAEHISDIWADGGPGHYTRREPMYFSFLERLLDFEGGSVLEIGPGTGRFASMLIGGFDIEKYTVLDLEKNIFDSVNHVKNAKGFELHYVFARDYRNVFGEQFDLVVSNVCIPETPKEYREELLGNVLPNARQAMIIGQLNGAWVEGDEYEVWLRGLFGDNFQRVACELTPYCNCYAMAGAGKDLP